jgi:cell division septation protein DedD
MILAQATQPIDWNARITLWSAIAVAAIAAFAYVAKFAIGKYKEIREDLRDLRSTANTNTQNIATNATVSSSIIKAQLASPGPNVPPSVRDASQQVKETPTIPIEAPTETDPIVTTPTPEAVTRGFNMANPPPVGPDVT